MDSNKSNTKILYKASNGRFSVYFETLHAAKVFASKYEEATIEEVHEDTPDVTVADKVLQIWRGS